MKTKSFAVLVLGIALSWTLALAQSIYVTKGGHMAGVTEQAFDKGMDYIVQNDLVALQKLMDAGFVFPLKAGLRVYLMDRKLFSGKVKIRPQGSTVELWTVHAAIERASYGTTSSISSYGPTPSDVTVIGPEDKPLLDDSPAKPSDLGTVNVSFEPAGLLAKPGLEQEVVEDIWSSTDLTVLAENKYWLQVETPEGKTGWIAKNWIAPVKEEASSGVEKSETRVIEHKRKKSSKKVVKTESPRVKISPKATDHVGVVQPKQDVKAIAGTHGSLDSMLSMVRNKEDEQRRRDEEERKRREERERHQAELKRNKQEQIKRKVEPLKRKIAKYLKIVSSPYGRDMKEEAWYSLVSEYPEAAEKLDIGDVKGLLYLVSEGTEGVLLLPKGTIVQTIHDSLGLWPSPEFSDYPITTMKKGTELVILDKQELWYMVKTPNGKTGWVSKNWVEEK